MKHYAIEFSEEGMRSFLRSVIETYDNERGVEIGEAATARTQEIAIASIEDAAETEVEIEVELDEFIDEMALWPVSDTKH